MKYGVLWKLVFVVWLVIWLYFVFTDIVNQNFNENKIIGIGVALFGLYGLAFQKRILKQKYWKFFFWALTIPGVVTAGVTIYLAFTGYEFLSGEWENGNIPISHIIEIVRDLAFYLVLTLSIYTYSYKSRQIWNKSPNNAN